MHVLSRLVMTAPLSLALMAGCDTSWQLVERRVTLEVQPAPQAPLQVKTENGAVELTHAPERQTVLIDAVIRARTQERADATQVLAEPSPDGGIVVTARWPDRREGNEGCSFAIAAPGLSEADLASANGAITVKGFAGTVKLDTSNGAIRVEGFDGPIAADTSNGAITIVDATGVVKASTSNGSLDVSLTDANPGPVTLDTSNGAISLVVGSSFTGVVTASTSNGGVDMSLPNATSIEVVRGRGRAVLGSGGETSTLDTSNGRISVRAR